MNNTSKTNLLHSVLIGLLFGYTIVMTLTNANYIKDLRTQVDGMKEITRGPTMEFREADYAINERLDKLEDIDITFLFSRQNERLQTLEYKVMQLDKQVNFPYVSQQGEDAPYVNDCGSAAILMVAKFYGDTGNETVKYIHDLMIGSDLPSNYIQVRDFIEDYYGLTTKVIATHPAIKEDLVEQGYTNGDDIEVIDPGDFPNDKPVIWIYSRVPHWIVRYRNWAYDPLLGIRRFEATENIYRPDYGLGIIVTKGE